MKDAFFFFFKLGKKKPTKKKNEWGGREEETLWRGPKDEWRALRVPKGFPSNANWARLANTRSASTSTSTPPPTTTTWKNIDTPPEARWWRSNSKTRWCALCYSSIVTLISHRVSWYRYRNDSKAKIANIKRARDVIIAAKTRRNLFMGQLFKCNQRATKCSAQNKSRSQVLTIGKNSRPLNGKF